MRIAVCGFGSMWSARAANARPVYYNSTSIDTGKGLKPRPLIYGVVRIEAGTGINPYVTSQLIGKLLEGTGVREHDLRRQLTLHKRATGEPDAYLIAIRSCEFGAIDCGGAWKSSGVEVISFSEAGVDQEALLLISPYSWIRTARGSYMVERPVTPCEWRKGVLKETS